MNDFQVCNHCGARSPAEGVYCGLCGKRLFHISDEEQDSGTEAVESKRKHTDFPDKRFGAVDYSCEQLLRIAEDELANKRKESAARHYLRALSKEPDNMELHKTFWDKFTPGEIRYWNLQIPVKPIRKDYKGIRDYPLKDGGWLEILVAAVCLEGVSEFADALLHDRNLLNFMGMLLGVLAFKGAVYGYLASMVARHVKWAAAGRAGKPAMVEFDWTEFRSTCAAFLATALPLIASMIYSYHLLRMDHTGTSPKALLISAVIATSVFFIYLFPACLLTAAMFNRTSMAFYYSFVLKAINKAREDYAIVCLVFLLMNGIYFLAESAGIFRLPWDLHLLVQFFFWLLKVYGLIMFGHILGRFYYNHKKNFNWFRD